MGVTTAGAMIRWHLRRVTCSMRWARWNFVDRVAGWCVMLSAMACPLSISSRWLARTLATGTLLGSFMLAASAHASEPDQLALPDPEPLGIHGGQPVSACAWPTTVAVFNNGALCTGTLVHPRVVVYAAHCGGGNKKIYFGEDLQAPAHILTPDLCMTYPDYKGVSDQAHDWAFCRLPKPVTDIPITPVVYGCETEIVHKGRDAAVVGFGQTHQGITGRKNWGMTPIHSVATGSANVGGQGQPGICPGDSGGPAYVEYPDGSWHVFGIASTVTGGCGGVGTHSLMWRAVPWIEENSGIDITPCHDQDGTWRPTYRCDQFYSGAAGVGYGDWGDWCPDTPVGAPSETCGKAFNADPDNTPPVVAITTPTSIDLPDEGAYTTAIEVDANDGDGWGIVAVSLKINGQVQPIADEDPPYAFNMATFPKGTWELIAVAEDAAGLIGESEPVILQIGPAPEVPVETTASESDSEDSEDSAASDPTPTTSASDPSGDAGSDSAASASASASASDSTDSGPSGDDGDDGCGCNNTAGNPGGLMLGLVGVGLAWRRRRG